MGIAKLALYPDTDTLPTLIGITDLGTTYGFYNSAAADEGYMYVVVRVVKTKERLCSSMQTAVRLD